MKKNILLPFATMFILLTMSSCYFDGNYKNRIEGNGPIVSEILDIRDFDSFNIQNSANVVLKQGNKFHVEIEAQRNIINNLNTEVTGNIWKIRNNRPVWKSQKMTIYITMPEFKTIRISGSGDVSTVGDFDNLGDLELRISGSGDMDLDIDADDIYGRIGGSGSIRLSGKADKLDFRVTGSGDIYAMDLQARSAEASISGSGSIRVDVKERLDATVSGSGNIFYHGNPHINTRVSGSGNIQSR